MNTLTLNNVSLDGGVVIKRVKEGSSDGNTGGSTSSGWTGHADIEGLKAIGWDDEDIAYYQEHGVNWNEEDDEYHKVSDDNKALYGVLTTSNISSYKNRIVYLPKIDFSGVENMYGTFMDCYRLVAIPHLDISAATSIESLFRGCVSLTHIPMLDTSKVTRMQYTFSGCVQLAHIPNISTDNVLYVRNIFNNCSSLASLPKLNFAAATNMTESFQYCSKLNNIELDFAQKTNTTNCFSSCVNLADVYIKNLKASISFENSNKLSKESLLYIINNEAAELAITIKLAHYAYGRLANDVDIVEALANHPNVSLAK